MKARTRLSVGVAIAVSIILYISYKILEPEFWHSRASIAYNIHDDKGSHENEKEDKSLMVKFASNVEKYISEVELFHKVDFDYKLKISPWELAASWVKPREIVPEICPELGAVLNAMVRGKIIEADVGYKGTQLKLSLILEGGQKVAFKPQWFSREHIIEGAPYAGEDRHNGEIAAFHIARLLGLRRTPLVAGRKINLEREIKPVATQRLLDTFYSKGPNTCFFGRCYYCKGKDTGVCADGDILEGAVVLWLPSTFKLTNHRHPWQRTYKDGKKARWEVSDDYCDLVRKGETFRDGPRLLDLIDTTVLDYLIGNADRHNYETLGGRSDAMVLIMDNAKSFGNPSLDERTILAPLYQCCMIRKSLYDELERYQHGVLSSILKRVTSADPIAPVLSDAQWQAVDRRLGHVLREVNKCIEANGATQVLVEDR